MLKGRGALINGSTQGLGYAMAERLAAEGCHVMLNGLGDGAEIERKRRQLADGHGVRAFYHGADLAEPRQRGVAVLRDDLVTELLGEGQAAGGEAHAVPGQEHRHREQDRAKG